MDVRSSGRIAVAVAVAVAVSGCRSSTSPEGPADEGPVEVTSPDPIEWSAFSLDELRRGLDDGSARSVDFLSTARIRAALLLRRAGEDEVASTIPSSVVFYVLEGEGDLDVEGDLISLAPGDVAYVRGRAGRSFRNVSQDLLVLELVAVGRPGLEDPLWARFGPDDLLGPRNPNRNVLNQLFSTATLTLGAYMLPRELSGDLRVRHGVDELKVVLRGGATLEAGPDIHPVDPGSVVFLDGAVTHRFTRVSGDLDVLFLWVP
jgi:mannose-6-phosphate isomerase-like protein (cupin superfamily)